MSNALNNAAKGLNKTPQSQKAKAGQVKNTAGGFVFQVSDQSRLERFLILGVDGGTYSVSEVAHATSNVTFLNDMIERDEASVLATIVDVSVNGRAYKQSPVLFALASVIVNGKNKQAVKAEFNKVVRTGTHLYEVVNYLNTMGGWGRAKREIVAGWFDKDSDKLAYQMVKYRSRAFGDQKWTMRDVMRKSHPQGMDPSIAEFATKGQVTTEAPITLKGFSKVQKATSADEVLAVLDEFENLSWETIPTQFLKDVRIWKTLFSNGQLRGQALVRNIVRLARYGAFKDMMFAAQYAAALTDQKMIEQTRLHPINFLNALVVYTDGQYRRVKDEWYEREVQVKDWETESVIVDALNEGFHKSFKSVVPAGKRTMLAIDVSGSMGAKANGLDLSCAQVSAAMAMTIARTEPAHIIRGFTSGNGYGWRNSGLTDLGISARTDLATAMRNVQKHNWGGTDCSLPMKWALENGVDVDTFVVITDNDTWAGDIHPFQALKQYRKRTGIDARMAVLGVQATDFTIADPSDAGMMDFVGFDSNAPRVLADFSAGRI